MKRILALWVAAMLLVSAAWAEEEWSYVEPAGDGSGFEESPEELITAAMEIYSWFVMWPLDVDEAVPGGDGNIYALLDERFARRENMDQLLSAYFSPEIQKELWAWGMYTDIDGYLYAPRDGNWRWIDERIEEVSYRLSEASDSRREYGVTVYYADDGDEFTPEVEELTYVQERSGDGWQFTEFPFFW